MCTCIGQSLPTSRRSCLEVKLSKPQVLHVQQRRPGLHVIASVYTVTFQLPGGKSAVIKASSDGPSLYDMANRYGVPVPASCRQGSCTACCSKLISGTVSSKGKSCVPASLARQGYITLCTSRPTSDVTILTHQGRIVREANQLEAPKVKW